MQRIRSLLRGVIIGVGFLAMAPAAKAEGLRNLPATEKPRFTVTDRDWPAKPGEASICLWKDDKVAATSITIDDNWGSDHAWWLEQAEKYGFKFTWFVITGKVDGPNKAFNGTWETWKKLRDAGHDIQSHTVDHFGGEPPLPAEENYKGSVEQIEKNIPGHRVRTLAYPGGKNSVMNDAAIAAKYFVGARGTTGVMNEAGKINYMQTNSISGVPPLDADHKWAGFPNLLTLNARQPRIFRGWCSIHFHGIGSADATKDLKANTTVLLDYMQQHKETLWVAPFTDVVLYGQERDTAKLTADISPSGSGTIVVTDQMDDQLFDYPLTVKVRLDKNWAAPKAAQGGKPVALTVVEHEGAPFALVEVVPDRGEVTFSANKD